MKTSAFIERFRRKLGDVDAAAPRPLVLGHRGARAHAPENTFKAFDEALAQGADGVELDVRMSADAQLFIGHDDEVLVRGSAVRAKLSTLSRAQIEHLRLLSGEKVPFLDEVLAWQKSTGALINVELKGDVASPVWMAQRAAQQIQEHGGAGLVLSSFDVRIVRRLALDLPELPVGLLFHKDQQLMKRLVPYRALGAVAVHPEASLLTERRVAAFKAQGALVNVWTVNDPDEALRLSDWGVDALITDSPRTVLAALDGLF